MNVTAASPLREPRTGEAALRAHQAPRALILAGCAILIAGCSPTPGEIGRDAQPFDAIGEDAALTLVGNEPFWQLDIVPNGEGEYAGRYTTPENIDPAPFVMTRFAGNNGLGFSGKLGKRTMQVAVTPGACSDTMSDRTYPYTATIALGEETLHGCAYTDAEPFTGGEGS